MTRTQKSSKKSLKTIRELRGQVLDWYDKHRRVLPWRAVRGEVSNPYHVWLSEVMLQQTTVTAVKDYYMKFLRLWPEVQDLAAAEQDDVMAAWAGLGYYARARNLHKCAKVVANELGGVFPEEQADLKALPGIGDYTSAAIAAIAFNKPATVVDGNIERVMARLFNVREPMPASKKQLKALAHEFFDGYEERPGDLAQAFMDLGAGICIPKAPRCALCPLSLGCEARAAGDPEVLPLKSPKKKRPQKHGIVYWVQDDRGRVLLERREEKGLLGGMLALPTGQWGVHGDRIDELDYLKDIEDCRLHIDHVFTHFDLRLHLKRAKLRSMSESLIWGEVSDAHKAMPSLFQKAYKLFAA